MAPLLTELAGECPAIRAVRDQVRQLLASAHPDQPLPGVLIEGAPGTGKSLLAWLIHRSGPRADLPFVPFDCGFGGAGIPPELAEALFFGLARGPEPSGRRGLIEMAHRGTLFLEGIELLPVALQLGFERVLERRQIWRMGDRKTGDVDVRVISATGTSLRRAVEQGRFRPSLYERLASVTLALPALHEREDDVILLANRFLDRTCRAIGVPPKRLAPDAEARLRQGMYLIGEVRGLAEVIERVVSLTSQPVITAAMLAVAGLPDYRASD